MENRLGQNSGIGFGLFVVLMLTCFNKILTSELNDVNYPYI